MPGKSLVKQMFPNAGKQLLLGCNYCNRKFSNIKKLHKHTFLSKEKADGNRFRCIDDLIKQSLSRLDYWSNSGRKHNNY